MDENGTNSKHMGGLLASIQKIRNPPKEGARGMEPRAICDRCSREVFCDEINICDECGMDGLCNDCYAGHKEAGECEPDPTPEG